MKRLYISAVLILTLVLTACSATATPLQMDPQATSALSDSATRVDEQGAIVIEITPHNLGASADTLEFNVVMNSHSKTREGASTLTMASVSLLAPSRIELPSFMDGKIRLPST